MANTYNLNFTIFYMAKIKSIYNSIILFFLTTCFKTDFSCLAENWKWN